MHRHPTGHKTHRSECRLHSSVDEDHVASPTATGQQNKAGRGSVRQLNPAALQITLLMVPTWMPESERTWHLPSLLLTGLLAGSRLHWSVTSPLC